MRALRHASGAAAASLRDLFARSRAYRWLTAVSLLLVALTAFLPFWKVFPRATPGMYVPLHGTVYFGVDQFGPWWRLFTPAAFGLAVLAVNVAVGAWAFRRERLIALFFLGLTVFVETVLLIASTFMVLLNL